jgi:hypothetical protein
VLNEVHSEIIVVARVDWMCCKPFAVLFCDGVIKKATIEFLIFQWLLCKV